MYLWNMTLKWNTLKWVSGLPRWLSGKESAYQCRRHRRWDLDSWVGKIPWKRKWQPIPVFLPEKSHGQRSLEGYSPWSNKQLDATYQLSTQKVYHCEGKKKIAHLQDCWNYCPSIMQMEFVAQDKIFRVINIPETT